MDIPFAISICEEDDAVKDETPWRASTSGRHANAVPHGVRIRILTGGYGSEEQYSFRFGVYNSHHRRHYHVDAVEVIEQNDSSNFEDAYYLPAALPWEARLSFLRALPVEAGELQVGEGSISRASELLSALQRLTPASTKLGTPFITATGGGDIQLEWKQGDKYFEVEIPPLGPVSIWYESPMAESELQVDDLNSLIRTFETFWES